MKINNLNLIRNYNENDFANKKNLVMIINGLNLILTEQIKYVC